MKGIIAAAVAICLALAAQAQDLSGNWSGELLDRIHVVFHLSRAGITSYSGTMDSPDQNAFGLEFSQVTQIGDSLRCVLSTPKAEFDAVVTSDSVLTGTWLQGGGSTPLVLHRQAGPVTPAPDRPQTPHPPYPYHSDSVEYDNPAHTIHYGATLTYPNTGGPFPALVLITGSGIQDRDETIFGHKPFAVISDYLTRRGYAVLRVDDRTAGLSTGDVKNATSADFAKDVEVSLAYLKSRPEVDKHRMGLLGHSEGAMIAPMVAARNKDVAFIVLLACPAVGGYQTILYQSVAPLQGMGSDTVLIRGSKELESLYLEHAMHDADSAAFMENLWKDMSKWETTWPDSAKEKFHFLFPDRTTFESQTGVAERALMSPWFKFFLTYDLTKDLRRVHCPVLALNGSRDVQVEPEPNLALIKQLVPQADTAELPGLNHLFQHCHLCTVAEYGKLTETFSPEALTLIAIWLDKVTRAPQ